MRRKKGLCYACDKPVTQHSDIEHFNCVMKIVQDSRIDNKKVLEALALDD